MDQTHLSRHPTPLLAEAAERSTGGAGGCKSKEGTLGTLRIHGLGVVETFVIMEPDLNQLFAESELARDAVAWFFCSLGFSGSAAVTLATFAPTEGNLNWRYTVVSTLTAASLVLSLKMYATWRKHAACYARLKQQLRKRCVSGLVDVSLAAETPLQRIQRVDK